MKKFIFTLLVAMSFTSAIAKTTDTKAPGFATTETTVNIFKKQPVSNILKSGQTEQQCVMACFQTYRQCLGSAGTGSGYWDCELTMEQCTADCL